RDTAIALNDATLKPLARMLWRDVIEGFLVPNKMELAAALLSHSLQDNPSDLHFSPVSYASRKVKKATEYIAERDKILSKVLPGAVFDSKTEGEAQVKFDEGDLSLALHATG